MIKVEIYITFLINFPLSVLDNSIEMLQFVHRVKYRVGGIEEEYSDHCKKTKN